MATTYTYRCKACGTFDQPFPMGTAPAVIPCHKCEAESARSYQPTAAVFKTGGFYTTDKRSG